MGWGDVLFQTLTWRFRVRLSLRERMEVRAHSDAQPAVEM